MSAPLSRISEPLRALVRTWMSRVDYFGLYPAKVVQQNGDGTLALQPDLSRSWTGLDHVPVRLGLPGVTVKVASGSRVLLGFENGSPAHPVATLWEVSSVLELHVEASTKVTVKAPTVNLADDVPTDAVALASLVGTRLTDIYTALAAYAVADYGAAMVTKVAAMTSAGFPASVASSKVKAS